MNSDERKIPRPTLEDVRLAYNAYLSAREAYLEMLARYVEVRPEAPDPLFLAFANEANLLRVLHAVAVGYGLSEELYKVSTRAQVAQAQLRGFVKRDELHGGLVLTDKGAEALREWTEYMIPLREAHSRYQELWQAVTGLDG